MSRRTTRGDVYIAVAVFCISFGYFYAFRRLGWFMQDEGVLYYQYLRVYQGQLPYRDFFTGYPPLVYYLTAAAFRVFPISINAIRVLMGLVNSVTALALYLIARRVTDRGFAWIPPALFVVMHPADSAMMIFHNSPYPSWYALAFGIAGTWAMLRAVEAEAARPRMPWLVVTGVLGGLTFLSKQNAGIFFLWGVSGYLLSSSDILRSFPQSSSGNPLPAPPLDARLETAGMTGLDRTAGGQRKGRVIWIVRTAYLSLIPLAAIVLVKSYLSVVTVALFVVPLTALAALGSANRGSAPPLGAQRSRGTGPWWALLWPLIAVGAGVAVTVAPWIAYFGAQIGVGPFLKTLFFIGADVDLNSYVPFPATQQVTLLVLGPLALWGLLAWIARRRWPGITAVWLMRLQQLLAAAAIVALVVALGAQAAVIERLLELKYNLWQIYYTTSDGIDNLAAYGALLVLLGAATVAWRQQRASVLPADPPPTAFLCILWIAACTFLVYYPRMDNAHLVSAVPLVYVVGTGLLPRLRQGIADAFGGRSHWPAVVGFNVACLGLMLFVLGMKAAPYVYSRLLLTRVAQGRWVGETPQVQLRFARGDIYVPVYLPSARVSNQTFNDLMVYLNEHLRPGDPIFAFPALPMVYFISGHDNVTRQDYFFGDNVSFPEQLDVIRALEGARVPVVVAMNDPTEYFVMKGRDYTRVLSAYLHRRYYLERRFGPYDVMRRYGEGVVTPAGQR